MPNPHNRKPVYFRSSTPSDINVTDIKKHIYQWEETGSLPAEVENGVAWMPPFENAGEIRVWADSNTLNYPAIPNAPMFWSTGTLTGGAKDEKILQIINNAAGRKDGLQFYDVDDAILWVSAQDDIYTNATPTTSIGEGVANITMEVRTSGSISLDSFYFQNGTPAGVLYGTHGGSPMNNPVGYLPTSGDLAPITYNNVPINPVNGGKIGCQLNFTNGSNGIGKYITYYVNGVQMPPFQGGPFYTSTSIAFNFAFAGGIQNGDDIVCIITDIPGFAPLVEGAPELGLQTATASNYVRISSANDITANGQVHFAASNPPNGGIVQITRYDSTGADQSSKLATVIANRPAGAGSSNQYVSLGFNIEVDATTGSLTTGYASLGYNWGMGYSAYDTSTLGGPYANVANPTLKTINGVEVYEFVGTMETGYNTNGVSDATTPEPILINFRYA
jgi:hypothetical protein